MSPPAKASAAFLCGRFGIEPSVGPCGASLRSVPTAHRDAHPSQGPRTRAAALRRRVRLVFCDFSDRCHLEMTFLFSSCLQSDKLFSFRGAYSERASLTWCCYWVGKRVRRRLQRCDPFLSRSQPFRGSRPDLVIAWEYAGFHRTWGSTLLRKLTPCSRTHLWSIVGKAYHINGVCCGLLRTYCGPECVPRSRTCCWRDAASTGLSPPRQQRRLLVTPSVLVFYCPAGGEICGDSPSRSLTGSQKLTH